MSSENLRDRLIASDGFGDALSALRADRTLPVVAQWLRDEAAGHLEIFRRFGRPFDANAELLTTLADTIDPTPVKPTHDEEK